MHCSWAARLSPCNPEGHSTLPFASGLLAWPSWLSPTAEHVWDGVCWGGGGDGTGWLSKPCTPRGAGGGHDLTAAVTVQVVAGGGMGKGSRVLFQGWGWRREESSLTPCKWGDAGRDRASSYPLPWEDVGRG